MKIILYYFKNGFDRFKNKQSIFISRNNEYIDNFGLEFCNDLDRAKRVKYKREKTSTNYSYCQI